ncbi:MAG TPA: 4-hydroxyphenylacetate 3-hydroxylase N-terminal domain-containing protein [Caulobacteraceae bacterium]|nr:4-hydroxyphenylacetate 3-hydroxylase N-terminal domain-containing protein [Caulobacteraceae bacterium]
MALKSPARYVDSLRDGRVTYWDGERIDDITTHPRFATPIANTAADYDYDDPERGPILSYETADGGRAHRIFQIPRSQEDLAARVRLMHDISIGTAVSGVFMALMSAKDAVAEVSPRYADNIERMYRHCRDEDLRGAEVITDPKGDRKRRAHEQDDPDLYVRIVDRSKEGIVVRGAKLHISAASLIHELVVMPTKGMRQDEADYAVSFSVPVNAPGVKIINRSFAPPGDLNAFDYPISGRRNCPEGFVIFDDVFVPWDRVFLAGETQLASRLAQSLGLWERTGGVVEAVNQSRLFVGLAQLVSEMQGKEGDAVVQASIAELIAYAEMLRMSLDYACKNFERTPSGMVHPNILAINTAKYYYASNFHQMVRNLHDLGGGLVLTLPSEADLRSNETGPYMRKYLHTKAGVDVETRMRVYNLIRDMTADSLGGWNFVVALQAGGGLTAQRLMMNRTYDMATARSTALAAAGVD